MAGVYEHIRIEKEPLVNDRRTKNQSGFGGVARSNPVAHGQFLGMELKMAAQEARKQQGAEDGNLVLKINYTGSLDLSKLNKHGVEFVSQEDKTVCIVFASEQGLAEFADHLGRLGLPEGEELTYQNLLLALDGIGNWRRADRKAGRSRILVCRRRIASSWMWSCGHWALSIARNAPRPFTASNPGSRPKAHNKLTGSTGIA